MKTKKKKQKDRKITPEMQYRIHEMAKKTWQKIGPDILQCVEEDGGKPVLDRGSVLMCVTDAEHMETHGEDLEAYRFWDKLSYEQQQDSVSDAFPFDTYGW